jgi:HPt (histidine-containing phosphotransfer) domain-containing protein
MGASGLSGVAALEQQTRVIDEEHLGTMTLGDRRLEREVLEIFVRQTVIMLDRITGAEPALAAATAHTLIGSARGIGAWRVAQAAEHLEQAAGSLTGDAGLEAAVEELRAATVEASKAIHALLGGSLRGH